MLKRLALLMLLAAQAAGAQTSLVGDMQDMRGGAPTAEQARVDAARTNLVTLTNNYNTLLKAFNQYKRCANMGMVYAPTGSSLPGWVSSTKCAPFPNPPLVREIRFTSAVTQGNMGSGSTAYARMISFMNSNQCPTSTWHPCSEEEIRYAFGRNMADLDTASYSGAWIMGSELLPAMKFTAYTDITTAPYCSGWSSSSGSVYGYAVSLYNGSSTGKGITLATCNSNYPVACCR